MALIVEDGSIVENADSLVDLAFADSYFSSRLYTDLWDNATEEDQEKALQMASRLISDVPRWNGDIVEESQIFSLPRTGLKDKNGREIEKTEIPEAVKRAVCEFALSLLESNRLQTLGSEGLERLQIEGIRLDFTNQASRGSHRSLFPKVVVQLLESFTRMIGGKFARVIRT